MNKKTHYESDNDIIIFNNIRAIVETAVRHNNIMIDESKCSL